ncbi:YqgQ family protein [Paenisporosarcina macmurdoensis]|uniref:YqgQ family protein n=1 Tax=Paenisporosarcina macmurdoensis TaxID=212659 RepID=A0ABW1L8M3_9BACL
MKSIYDIMQLLKNYGTYIYTTERQADILLMEGEIRELYKSEMMDTQDYQMAILLLRQELSRLVENNIK